MSLSYWGRFIGGNMGGGRSLRLSETAERNWRDAFDQIVRDGGARDGIHDSVIFGAADAARDSVSQLQEHLLRESVRERVERRRVSQARYNQRPMYALTNADMRAAESRRYSWDIETRPSGGAVRGSYAEYERRVKMIIWKELLNVPEGL